MSTVQANLLKLAQIVDPTTANGQVIQGSSAAVSITGAANNGSGLIRITAANHGLLTGYQGYITGITGTTEANNIAGNPNWPVTRISSSTFDLVGSTFANAYINGGTVVGALIGSVDGAKFTRQRLLDIYNQARYVLFNGIYVNRRNDLNQLVHPMVTTANLTLTYGAPNTTAPKPSGYMRVISITSPTAGVPIIIMDNSLFQTVQLGTNPQLTQNAASNLTGFEVGSNFVVPAVDCHGTGTITYYGITDWAISDIWTGTATETFTGDMEPILIEVAAAIANEQSNAEVTALAKTLLGKG